MKQLIFNSTQLTLLGAAVASGLIAGLFYAYSCSVNPGLGRLPTPVYLASMQSINRVIENPLFILLFIGTPVLLLIITYQHYKDATAGCFRLLLAATMIYWIGSLGVTVFGNLPLNARLDSVDLGSASPEQMEVQRDAFRHLWNLYHSIRTVASTLSFILVIVVCIHKK